ncbi:MAG: hypothetical protein CMO80_10440 [Verrucomicrobiales bacterium]|nr:hypothetical protein [Verrucomicrobiales bacterium]
MGGIAEPHEGGNHLKHGTSFRGWRSEETTRFVEQLIPTCKQLLEMADYARKNDVIWDGGEIGPPAAPLLPELLKIAQAPDFSVPPLHGDERVSLKDYRGRWVYLDFWSTGCPSCVYANDKLGEALENHGKRWKDRLEIMTISRDESRDDSILMIEERQWKGMHHTWNDPKNHIVKIYRAGLPDAMLIDPEGTIVWRGYPFKKDPVKLFDEHVN